LAMQKDHQLVRHKVNGVTFEVLTKLGAVLKFRKGELGWAEVLYADEIFKSYSKAEKAKGVDLTAAFGTENVQDCAKVIVEKGELQLTANERKEFVEKKRAEIVNYIHKYYVDPRAKTPHPVLRIENALDELKFKVDADVPTEKQVQEIVKRLPEVLPIKRQEMEGLLTIPNKHMGSCHGVIQKYVKIINERYSADGCAMQVSLVPGDYQPLLNDLNRLTKGDFQFEIEGAEKMAATSEDTTKKKAGGGGRGGRKK